MRPNDAPCLTAGRLNAPKDCCSTAGCCIVTGDALRVAQLHKGKPIREQKLRVINLCCHGSSLTPYCTDDQISQYLAMCLFRIAYRKESNSGEMQPHCR